MTCSEQLLLLRARYGVLHVLYIFSNRQHVLQMAKMYTELARIGTIDTELG